MANNILNIDDHYLHYPKDSWGGTDLNNPDMVNPWLEIQEIVDPRRVIEIGMFAGHGSLLMMNVFKNLVSLDSYDPGGVAATNARQIQKYYPQHTFYKQPIWGKESRHTDIDLIFVDGMHDGPEPYRDLESCMKIKPRYVLVDNIEKPDVRIATKLRQGLWATKYEPRYWFYTNSKYSSVKKCEMISPGIMGLFKMEGNYEHN
tara:strand:- start:253 stop:861 length:609 start_codon:yes stop_codon:yes gene_type:complete